MTLILLCFLPAVGHTIFLKIIAPFGNAKARLALPSLNAIIGLNQIVCTKFKAAFDLSSPGELEKQAVMALKKYCCPPIGRFEEVRSIRVRQRLNPADSDVYRKVETKGIRLRPESHTYIWSKTFFLLLHKKFN